MSTESPELAPEMHRSHGNAIGAGEALPPTTLGLRSAAGGILMGLANLVPGISGGTMLLAAGIYPNFISAIAEISTLHFKWRSVLTLGIIAVAAGLSILLLAGTMKTLVIENRWVMYSLFIGLSLGGVPLVWRLARPATPTLWVSATLAFALMCLMAMGEIRQSGHEPDLFLLAVSGLAGASAMILPGISGGYLLLLLGQYETILGAVDGLKQGLLGGSLEPELLSQSLTLLAPVGLGVAVGIVGVANLIRWLLDRFEKPTLGMLLGLLLGSVVGLYPFHGAVPPEVGDLHKGSVLTAEAAADLDPEDWPTQRFVPSPPQAALSLGLILVGLGATLLVDRIGSKPQNPGA
ncbi:MAG: DUF368 domain-containing protein [Myxococcota bacterium]|nr:DUF368 domain-containing protein [Myxococcota bacterium]